MLYLLSIHVVENAHNIYLLASLNQHPPPPSHYPACCKCKDSFMNDEILEFQFCLNSPGWVVWPV